MEANYFTILYWFCHTSTWICHGIHVFPILNSPPTSLPVPSLWVIPMQESIFVPSKILLLLLPFMIHGLIQFSSVAQSCPTLRDPMDCSTPGLPVHHQLPEFTQTHVHDFIRSVLFDFQILGDFQLSFCCYWLIYSIRVRKYFIGLDYS